MKKRLIALMFVFSAHIVGANSLRMIFDYKSFYQPKTGNYLELYFQFLAASTTFKKVDGHVEGKVNIQVMLTQKDSIKAFDHYEIKSYALGDSVFEDFYSIKRFSVTTGDYLLEIAVFDVYNSTDTLHYSEMIHVEDNTGNVFFSDIELVQTYASADSTPNMFSKSGLTVVPLLLNYFDNETQNIIFYNELYNTQLLGDSARFLLKFYIEDAKTHQAISNFAAYKRVNATEVIPSIQAFDIETLPSGEYNVVVELWDEEGQVLRTQKTYFDRYNALDNLLISSAKETIIDPVFQKELHSDSLFYYMMSLQAISSASEKANISDLVKKRDTLQCQKYFQAYWKKTSPVNPSEAWTKYKKLIRVVEENYGTSTRSGFETDRGVVFLKYGVPNTTVSRPNDPGQYPYEIWQYYHLDKRNNVRFVFYNPQFVGNDYRLIYSDLPNEHYNANWQSIISVQGNGDQNGTHMNDMNILNSNGGW